MKSGSFAQFGGMCGILAGAAGFLYAVSFIIVSRATPDTGRLFSALFLMLGGVLSTAALVAVYERLRATDAPAALWALLLGIAGTMGAAIHGAYDLAIAIHPVAAASAAADLPSPIDPRGLLTFAVTGLSLLVIAWLMRRNGSFPRGLSGLGNTFAVLLLVLYLGRLIILTPTHPAIVWPALLAGFLAGPAWWVWLGVVLRRVEG